MSNKVRNIKLLVTDDNTIKEIMWFKHTGKEFFFGEIMEGIDFHVSYHENGKIHWKILKLNEGGKPKYSAGRKYQPLTEFKGHVQLGFLALDKNSLENYYKKQYNMKKCDNIIHVDTRSSDSNQLSISVHLVETGRRDLIPISPNENPNIHIITSVSPWLVVATY